MPRTHGDSFIHVDDINVLVEVDQDLPEVSYSSQINDSDKIIAGNCASLIDDKATLQMGIGNIPDAVLKELLGHKDLGIHTEMFSDGILDLIDKGVITNKFKKNTGIKLCLHLLLAAGSCTILLMTILCLNSRNRNM